MRSVGWGLEAAWAGLFPAASSLQQALPGWGNSLAVLTPAGSSGTAVVFTFGRLPCYLERFISLRHSEWRIQYR